MLALGGGIASARRRFARPLAIILLIAIAAFVPWWHLRAARSETELKVTLDSAIRLRDSGKVGEAEELLEAAVTRHPASHVPHALLGEIYYRTGRPYDAARAYKEAVSIKQDYAEGYKYLTVIHLAANSIDEAREESTIAKRLSADDIEIHYLHERSNGRGAEATLQQLASRDERAYENLAALAFEVNDTTGAKRFLEAGLARFPNASRLYDLSIRSALAARDVAGAQAIARQWISVQPNDPGAQRAMRALSQGR
jgi:tetratricopeptide (TPR) repeat protein